MPWGPVSWPFFVFGHDEKSRKIEKLDFCLGKAEIGLGTTIFGISAKNDALRLIFRPNPCPGDPLRDHLKISIANMMFFFMRVPLGARV